jgi:hypothetical protein
VTIDYPGQILRNAEKATGEKDDQNSEFVGHCERLEWRPPEKMSYSSGIRLVYMAPSQLRGFQRPALQPAEFEQLGSAKAGWMYWPLERSTRIG